MEETESKISKQKQNKEKLNFLLLVKIKFVCLFCSFVVLSEIIIIVNNKKSFSVQKTGSQWCNWSKKCPRHGFVALGD